MDDRPLTELQSALLREDPDIQELINHSLTLDEIAGPKFLGQFVPQGTLVRLWAAYASDVGTSRAMYARDHGHDQNNFYHYLNGVKSYPSAVQDVSQTIYRSLETSETLIFEVDDQGGYRYLSLFSQEEIKRWQIAGPHLVRQLIERVANLERRVTKVVLIDFDNVGQSFLDILTPREEEMLVILFFNKNLVNRYVKVSETLPPNYIVAPFISESESRDAVDVDICCEATLWDLFLHSGVKFFTFTGDRFGDALMIRLRQNGRMGHLIKDPTQIPKTL